MVKATNRQLWALYTITKKDYRNANLSKDEASRMISEALEAKGQSCENQKISKNDFIEFFKANLERFTNKFQKISQIKSVVETDSGNRYAFIGSGCGISVIKYDKRIKRMNRICSIAGDAFRDCCEIFISSFDEETVDYYQRIGCPLGAIFYQDYDLNSLFKHITIEYAKSKGVNTERMYVQSWYD